MEPENVADYSKREYWDTRYTTEDAFDWFTTVYSHSLDVVVLLLKEQCRSRRADLSNASSSTDSVRVLHLGCGNSRLCADVADRWATTPGLALDEHDSHPLQLEQIALDYSPVVIERMAAAHANVQPPIHWAVDDVRTLASITDHSIDLVIDKGTMDALQADKENDNMDEDIEQMMRQVSRVMRAPSGSSATDGTATCAAAFVQFTWEIPYYRLHHTKKDEYAWGAQTDRSISHGFLGESDLYRWFVYRVL
jgi:EEF1A lysine methyltransferase 4